MPLPGRLSENRHSNSALAHLQLRTAHRKFVRTTNLIERSFEEERRRTQTIPRFFDEHGALKLVFGALTRATAGGSASA